VSFSTAPSNPHRIFFCPWHRGGWPWGFGGLSARSKQHKKKMGLRKGGKGRCASLLSIQDRDKYKLKLKKAHKRTKKRRGRGVTSLELKEKKGVATSENRSEDRTFARRKTRP